MDLPHPSNLTAEGQRIFFTFAGIAIAIVLGLASLLQKRKAPAAASQEATTSIGKAPAN